MGEIPCHQSGRESILPLPSRGPPRGGERIQFDIEVASMERFRFLPALAALASITTIVLLARAPALADPRDISVGGVYICTITHDASGYSSYNELWK